MSKIVFENKKGKITIINKLSYPESVNERVYNAIASGMFEGFLPVSIREKRKETRVECVVQELIPLNQYFNGLVTKKMFLDFVYHIAQHIKNCEKNMINANNLDLQSDKIFIEPQSKAVKCIFWPIVNNQRGNQPYLFLKQLPYELNFNPHEDNEYLETYKAFFGGVNPFSVNSFERMILKLQGKQVNGRHSTPSGALSGTLSTDSKSDKKAKDGKKVVVEYDPFAETDAGTDASTNFGKAIKKTNRDSSACYCGSCGAKNDANANFCVKCGTKIVREKVCIDEIPEQDDTIDFGTMVLGDDSGGTTVLGYDEPEEPVFPVLTRERTDESFKIDKPTYRIGTEQKYCDLFISDNNFISRSHADIITKDERYYIIDRNSTNKTFVDGKVIPIEKEVEIFSGTKIRLANEDFTFIIEM